MNKDKGKLLDSFYNGSVDNKNITTQQMKNATYSLKLENIHYVDLRATHFESKSAFIQISARRLHPLQGGDELLKMLAYII